MESDQDIIKNSVKQLIEDFKRKKLVIPQYLKQILGQMICIERIRELFSPTKPKIISKTCLDENPTTPHKSVQIDKASSVDHSQEVKEELKEIITDTKVEEKI